MKFGDTEIFHGLCAQVTKFNRTGIMRFFLPSHSAEAHSSAHLPPASFREVVKRPLCQRNPAIGESHRKQRPGVGVLFLEWEEGLYLSKHANTCLVPTNTQTLGNCPNMRRSLNIRQPKIWPMSQTHILIPFSACFLLSFSPVFCSSSPES